MTTTTASTPRKKTSRKPIATKTATAKSSTPTAVKSTLGKPAASPARPEHTGTRKSVKPAPKASTKANKPAPKGRKVSAPKAQKPVNNLPLRPSVGMRLRTTMRDLYVIGVKLGAIDRVVCLAVGSGYRFKRTTIQWKALRTDKGTRWV